MKKNWKAIVAVLALALMVGGIAFYVHGVYLPARQAQKANELRGDAQETATIEQTSYDYTIKVEPSSKADNKDSGVTVTTDKDGNVWISRDWTGDTSGYERTDGPDEISESGAVANIGSGVGENIVDEDGVYYGEQEQPENTTRVANSPLPVMTVGPTPTPPPSIESVTPTATQATPTPVPETPPVATATPSAPAQRPASNDSATPKQGDTRTVDGQQQMWVDGWGWVPVGSGGGSEPSKGTNTEIGEPVPNASFG